MDRAGAAEGEQDKISGVVPFLYSRLSNQVTHVRVRDPIDAACRFDGFHAERLCDLVSNSIESGCLVERHSAAQEIVFIQIA